MRHWPAVLAAALTREAIAGRLQDNAVEVANYYRERAPDEWVDELVSLNRAQLVRRADTLIERSLEPVLDFLDLELRLLEGVKGALSVVEALVDNLDAEGDAPLLAPQEDEYGDFGHAPDEENTEVVPLDAAHAEDDDGTGPGMPVEPKAEE